MDDTGRATLGFLFWLAMFIVIDVAVVLLWGLVGWPMRVTLGLVKALFVLMLLGATHKTGETNG